jgi:hypothetical protein
VAAWRSGRAGARPHGGSHARALRSSLGRGDRTVWLGGTDALIAARHACPPTRSCASTSTPCRARPLLARRDDRRPRRGGPQEYADPTYDELTRLLGGYLGVAPTQILVGAGADEILSIICQTFLDPGDAVVVTAPTYPVHTLRPQQLGATVRVCPLDADFSPDPERLLAAAVGAKLLILCSPNNPTGNAFDPGPHRADHRRQLPGRARRGVCGVRRLVRDPAARPPPAPDRRAHDVKAFALAGMRLGYAVAGSEAIDLLRASARRTASARDGADRRRRAARPPGDARQRRAGRGGAAAAGAGCARRARASTRRCTNFLLTDWGGRTPPGRSRRGWSGGGSCVRNYAHHRSARPSADHRPSPSKRPTAGRLRAD